MKKKESEYLRLMKEVYEGSKDRPIKAKKRIVSFVKKKTERKYLGLICYACGKSLGKYSVGCSSVHYGKCDYCGKKNPVMSSRDWGYPPLPERRKRK